MSGFRQAASNRILFAPTARCACYAMEPPEFKRVRLIPSIPLRGKDKKMAIELFKVAL
jgi:hypothetical protein